MTEIEIARSNSLADLAHRIKEEHQAVSHALKRGLDHAIAAGELLIEAKALVPHGRWLPWLKEHCQIPERSVQRYMELARSAPVKSDNVADLSFEQPSTPDCDDLSGWVKRSLDAPFAPADIDGYSWMMTKLMHQAGIPWTVQWCFDVSEFTDGRPSLRLSPWDDLMKAAEALASLVNGKRTLKFDGFTDMHSMQSTISMVEICVMWLLGDVLSEMQHRDHISEKRYEQERNQIHQWVMEGLEKKRAEYSAAAH